MNAAALVASLGISFDVTSLGMKRDDTGWDHYAYRIMLARGNEVLETVYNQGLAHDGLPQLPAVLGCLLSDTSAGESPTFEDFCSEFGLDTDSRKAEATYRACQRVAADLRRVLGADFDAVAAACAEEGW